MNSATKHNVGQLLHWVKQDCAASWKIVDNLTISMGIGSSAGQRAEKRTEELAEAINALNIGVQNLRTVVKHILDDL